MKTFRYALFDFCYIPKYDQAIEFLALNLAAPESWDFADAEERRYPILKNYLEYTFRKLRTEEKIYYTTGNEYACFNTGLVTPNLEAIYALCQRNRGIDNPQLDVPPYWFKAFVRESDSQLIRTFGNRLPAPADYFECPEDLVFDPTCRLVPQIDRIIEDNLERFPAELRELTAVELHHRLAAAIDETGRRVRANYRLAVPQFYENRIQLLLPLYLTPGSSAPDLALITHRVGADTYTSRMCLTLRMAYNNARLIARPGAEWLDSQTLSL